MCQVSTIIQVEYSARNNVILVSISTQHFLQYDKSTLHAAIIATNGAFYHVVSTLKSEEAFNTSISQARFSADLYEQLLPERIVSRNVLTSTSK